MKTRRQWLWIAFGVGIVLLFVAIGAILITTAWVQQNLEITEASESSAQQQFDSVLARYQDRPPLLVMRDGRPAYAAGKAPTPPPSAAAVDRLHVLAWDPRERRLVSVSVPFWFLRLKSGPIEFSAYASGLEDEGVDLRPEDIEKHGPGIIIDATSPDGERVLLWAQ